MEQSGDGPVKQQQQNTASWSLWRWQSRTRSYLIVDRLRCLVTGFGIHVMSTSARALNTPTPPPRLRSSLPAVLSIFLFLLAFLFFFTIVLLVVKLFLFIIFPTYRSAIYTPCITFAVSPHSTVAASLWFTGIMSDALCGPSNALQNFQKHASVDRTLQQDRLISRQPQSQVSLSRRVLDHHEISTKIQLHRASGRKIQMKDPWTLNSPRSSPTSQDHQRPSYTMQDPSPPLVPIIQCPAIWKLRTGRQTSNGCRSRDLHTQFTNNLVHRWQRNKDGRTNLWLSNDRISLNSSRPPARNTTSPTDTGFDHLLRKTIL